MTDLISDYLYVIIMLIIGLFGIFKDYFFKDEIPRWVVVASIILLTSSAALQISSTNKRFKQEEYTQYSGRISGDELLEYPAIKIGTAVFRWTGTPGEPIFMVGDDPIIVWLENGKLKISAIIRNEEGKIIAKIDANQWTINPNLILDRNFDSTAVEVIDDEGKVVLQAELEEDGVAFAGSFYRSDGWKIAIGENVFELRPPDLELEIKFDPLFKYPSSLHPGERK